MTQPASVSIIILTWNGIELTRACLESLRRLTRGIAYRVLVVDNGSTDGTAEWLRTLDWITLTENKVNEGFVRGNNRALRSIPADQDVVLLNNDVVILEDDWLRRLHSTAHADPLHGIVGCRMYFPDSRLIHVGTVMPLHNYHGFQISSGQVDIGQYPGVREAEGMVGACFYIRADVRERIGLLSEEFESYFEDADYCLRAQQAGYKVVCDNSVRMVHHIGASTKDKPAVLNEIFGRSRATFIRKWDAALTSRYKQRLRWRSRIHENSAWASITREVALALDAEGVDVSLEHIDGAAAQAVDVADPRIEQMKRWIRPRGIVEVVLGPPSDFHRNAGTFQVGYTVPGPGGAEAPPFDVIDEVWVPSEAGREALVSSGFRRPVHVVPFGFDPAFFHPNIRGSRATTRYTFLAVTDGSPRSGCDLLLRAYAMAFGARDDVLLLLNRMPAPGDAASDAAVEDLAAKAKAPVTLLERHAFIRTEMPALYRSADCFVLPARWCAFGLSALEAMACGLPVIAAERGGHRDFLAATNGYLARVTGDGPDVEHLAALMRHVVEHRDEAAARGAQAARDAVAGWTWRHTALKIIERMDALSKGSG